jgi:hypothetical protein
MRFFITCDSFWEAQVDKVIDRIDDTGYKRYFSEQDYGTSLDGITVVLMCQAPNLNLKQRIRLSKKEKKIYLDIMLDLPHFLEIAQKEREKIIVDKLIAEIPSIITKYKLEDFNLMKFETDLKNWMSKIL